jgi:uncharacterized protein YjiS (DUF1127 family)
MLLFSDQFEATATTNLNRTAKMLMKSSDPSITGRLAQQADALFGFLWQHAKQLYKTIKHRREIASLANQDDHLLADIGLTRADVHHAIAQPLWRDPTETLRHRAAAARRRGSRVGLFRQPTNAVSVGSPNSAAMTAAA